MQSFIELRGRIALPTPQQEMRASKKSVETNDYEGGFFLFLDCFVCFAYFYPTIIKNKQEPALVRSHLATE